MTTMTRVADTVAAPVGAALSLGIGALGAVTRRVKPFHPHGELKPARLIRTGAAPGVPRTGSVWIDEPGSDEAVVRISAGVGLPQGWPDIHGIAIAAGRGGARADVLLVATGTGPVSRHLLLPTREASSRTLTTLLPYESDGGPLYLSATPDGEDAFTLAWAGLDGPWRRFGRLELDRTRGDGDEVSFDPVLHVPHGLRQYGWVRALREPAYLTARARTGRAGGEERE